MNANNVFAEWVETLKGDSHFARIDTAVERIGFSRTYLYEICRGDKSVSKNVADAVFKATQGDYTRDELLFGRDTAA